MKPLPATVAALTLGLLLVAGDARADLPAKSTDDAAIRAVRAAILGYAEAVNRADPEGVIRVMAEDIVLSYPGTPDSDYATLVKNYREMMQPKAGVKVRTEPVFEEIFASGDLVVARLVWTTTTTDEGAQHESVRRMKDLQVWRRDGTGTWKFARGMHYLLSKPAAADPAK
jgi:ketosteroid isomerase-like protein